MTKNIRLVFAAALTLSLLAMPAVAAEGLYISEAGGEIAWAPNKAFGTAQLSVSGPNGYHFEHTFADGETPSLALVDRFGEAADGGYTWSLTVTSKISDSLRADMEAARAAGDASYLEQLKAEGLFSSDTYTGHFTKRAGQLIVPELSAASEGDDDLSASAKALPTKAQVFTTDVIVQASECVGVDCTSSESFGFDTLRLKENNLRIKFDDTSSSGSFPNNDWTLVANDTGNGGANRFSVEDATNNKTPFTIEANSPNNTLYVDSAGRIGIQTNSPAVQLHVKDGNSPTLRLEQDGSDGFESQTWDLAGNEANFFLRDVTNGSTLPFRVKPGSAKNAVFIDEETRVGFGVTDNGPDQDVHMLSTDGDGQLLLQETGATGGTTQRVLLKIENNGIPSFQMEDTSSTDKWAFSVKSEGFEFSKGGTGVQEFLLDPNGNLTIAGTLTTAGATYPDYVFRDGYNLLSLDEVEAFIEANGHLPNVKSEADVEYGKRIDITTLSISLLEKVEELTLYTIDQHKTIGSQQQMINKQNELILQLEERLSALEAR